METEVRGSDGKIRFTILRASESGNWFPVGAILNMIMFNTYLVFIITKI